MVFDKKVNCSLKDWETTRFCSALCGNTGSPIFKICLICSTQFNLRDYGIKQRETVKCCSRKCSNELRKSIEFREKLSVTQRAKVPPQHVFIRTFTSLLKTCSKYSMWREVVLKRDNFTCQICTKRGGKLQVDHINPFVKIILDNKIESYEQALSCSELWNTENGRTLCLPCHYKTPTFGSKVLKLIN